MKTTQEAFGIICIYLKYCCKICKGEQIDYLTLHIMLFVVDSADISPLSSLTINELYEHGESLARNDVPDINAGN